MANNNGSDGLRSEELLILTLCQAIFSREISEQVVSSDKGCCFEFEG
jgi:hypothetical protein